MNKNTYDTQLDINSSIRVLIIKSMTISCKLSGDIYSHPHFLFMHTIAKRTVTRMNPDLGPKAVPSEAAVHEQRKPQELSNAEKRNKV